MKLEEEEEEEEGEGDKLKLDWRVSFRNKLPLQRGITKVKGNRLSKSLIVSELKIKSIEIKFSFFFSSSY